MSNPQNSINPFSQHPKTLLPLFLTELWERFSFYGIRPLIILLLATSLLDGGFGFDHATASAIAGIFAGMLYFFTLPGGWLADHYLGQAKSVWWGSILIACGHLSIALSALGGHLFFFAGLTLIVLGTGLFKTCISVLVGRLYDANDARRDGGYMLFYMGINIGGFTAPFLTGLLAQQLGWHWGFGIGGVGMLIALITYRLFVHPKIEHLATPPKPMSNTFVATLLGGTMLIIGLFAAACYHWGAERILSSLTYTIGLGALGYFIFLFTNKGLTALDRKKMFVCGLLFAAATVFWAALEQQPLGLTLFIEDYVQRTWFGLTIPATWFYSLNPLFIIFCAPLLSLLLQRWSQATVGNYMLKAVISLLITALSFLLLNWAAQLIVATHNNISPLWIVLIYLLQSVAELLISPVGLAAISLLAPRALQSQMMGFWFISSSLGNLISGKLGGGISPDKLDTMPQLFGQTGFWLLGSAIVLLLTVPLMKRWMTVDHTTTTTSVTTQND